MKRIDIKGLTNKSTLFSILGVVIITSSIIANTALSAPNSEAKDVNVVNIPSVIVANTPTVNLSEGSKVNVVGLADVNIKNKPTVYLESGTIVNVGNQETSPIPVRIIDSSVIIEDPAKQPFVFNDFKEELGTNVTTFNVEVPSGKRLVIEQVSVDAKTYYGGFSSYNSQDMYVVVTAQTLGKSSRYTIAGTTMLYVFEPERYGESIASSQMRLYADPETIVSITIYHSDEDNRGRHTYDASLSGYLVNMT